MYLLKAAVDVDILNDDVINKCIILSYYLGRILAQMLL
jgi:hypothetical protein